MSKNVKAVPEGYHTVTPYLVQRDTKKAIEFYVRAFGAETRMTMPGPDGRIMHADLRIGDSTVFMTDEFPEMCPDTKSPQTAGCVTSSVFLYVPDADAVFKRAVDAGAKVITPVTDMFWGDRFGQVADPFGHRWSIATRQENLTPQEISERRAAWEKQQGR